MQEIKKWSFLSGINFKDSFISSVFILLKHCMNMKKNHYPIFWPSISYASLPCPCPNPLSSVWQKSSSFSTLHHEVSFDCGSVLCALYSYAVLHLL